MSRARNSPGARAGAQVSAVRHRAGRAPEPEPQPEINIVNLSDSEFALLQALRGLAAGRIEVVVREAPGSGGRGRSKRFVVGAPSQARAATAISTENT